MTAEKRYPEALAALERMVESDLARPDLLFEKAGLYLRLRRWEEARQIYERALRLDPDNAHAHLGICRIAFWQREFGAAAQSALDALDRIHEYPLAHFLLGRALAGMEEYKRVAAAFQAAISLNSNFLEAHVRLALYSKGALGTQHLHASTGGWRGK